jgi:hypothetical protein
MENDESGVMILDEGIEESAENLEYCCSSGPKMARTA